ncbi:restriction endonuclease [Paenibacillus sp. JZ16]|uniref:restriction endonuclease n=1 Tax=Paenibacillus sp. JZ16 TaxID=1906272 RepID=UPI00188C2937|nr:restriction endonuclease [Paenibacillus sp. JZ16]
MAKTYKAEGQQLAYVLRGLFTIAALSLYFINPKLHWGVFVGVFILGLVVAQWVGAAWTRNRRANKKSMKHPATRAASTTTSNNMKSRSHQTKALTKLTDAQLITRDVHNLSGPDFERLMELYYKDQGYAVERVGGSGDSEVDLILRGKEGYKIAVQCKRWKQNVGNDIVLRLKAGKQVHGCYDAWVVTTSNFTKDARRDAERLNIQLINGIALENKLNAWKRKKRIG